ncbi:MAG: hypothetical protein PVJ21_24020 [Anaerolineales bacterium]|jgi:hypothetical protein
MNNSNFIRLSGWSFIIGAIAFLPGAIGMLSWEGESTGPTPVIMQLAAFAVFLAPVLLAVGMLGLWARYRIGGGVLLFGAAIGGLLVIVGTLVQFLTPDYSVSETYFGVWLGGVLILNLCLSIYGIMALIQKPLPRWNWLPLAAGSWIVLLPLLFGIIGSPSSPIIIAVLVIMTILQVMLGYILQADVTEETKISQQGHPA